MIASVGLVVVTKADVIVTVFVVVTVILFTFLVRLCDRACTCCFLLFLLLAPLLPVPLLSVIEPCR